MYHAGNIEKKKLIVDHINNNEHVLIHGKEGTGKSSFVKDIKLKNCDVHYIERYNNIDFSSAHFLSLFSISNVFMQKRMIVLDNFDTVEVKNQKIIGDYIKKSVFPVVIICIDINKIIEPIKNSVNVLEFESLSFDEFKNLIIEWKNTGIIKIDKDPEKLFKMFDGNIRRLMNNYSNYENADASATDEEISAKKLARLVFSDKSMFEIFNMLIENKYKIKTVMEYINASLSSFYASMTKISIASDILSYINTILFESSNFHYIAGLLLTLPEKDYNGRLTFVKINRKEEREEVEDE